MCYREGMATYLIHAPELRRVKIGSSNRVRHRFHSIATACPCAVKLLGVTDEDEYALHARFRGRHIRGEWYDDSVLAEIIYQPLERREVTWKRRGHPTPFTDDAPF